MSSDKTYRFVIIIVYCLSIEMLTYCCREYLDIIDLTEEPEGSAESDSEIDDPPLPPITMTQSRYSDSDR